jgi:TetR/AcrR family transcriptional regulator, transcriptional repressor for nem operon
MGEATTRDRIVEAADDLFYRQGFDHTSFSDIAKDDILEAVIALRLANTKRMLERWAAEGATPEARIRSFIHMMADNRNDIMAYGCPVGTLCTELAKLEHGARAEANGLFTLFRHWLAGQFRLLGRERDADALAMHLLARSQGVATLANAFHDEAFIEREIMRLDAWLGSIAATAAH